MDWYQNHSRAFSCLFIHFFFTLFMPLYNLTFVPPKATCTIKYTSILESQLCTEGKKGKSNRKRECTGSAHFPAGLMTKQSIFGGGGKNHLSWTKSIFIYQNRKSVLPGIFPYSSLSPSVST